MPPLDVVVSAWQVDWTALLLIGLGKPISFARAALPPRGITRLKQLDELNKQHLRGGV
ncbi:hypothetical protein [Arthrobacter sp. SO3]|uniref:hypothetical protein n=1 Tax=Arthrobacter sp. SO3 TaxID=1897057 RepID=UPI001CFF7CF2|nr:hypothetical protein [Arthrobacter sp. SO3]